MLVFLFIDSGISVNISLMMLVVVNLGDGDKGSIEDW